MTPAVARNDDAPECTREEDLADEIAGDVYRAWPWVDSERRLRERITQVLLDEYEEWKND